MTLVLAGCHTKQRPHSTLTTSTLPLLQAEAGKPIRLANGMVELVIDPAKGRIMHYGFVGGANILWTSNKAVEFAPKFGGWENWGGDKTWPWPQGVWGWPPPVPQTPWSCVTNIDGSVVMISPLMPKLGLRMIRRVELAKKGTEVTITSWFEAEESICASPMAMWAITQLPPTDLVLMRSVRAAGGIRINNMGDAIQTIQARRMTPRVAWLRRESCRSGKVGGDADAILSVYGDTAMLHRDLTEPVAMGTYDVLARGQVYSHPDQAKNIPVPGKSYIEVEFISPTGPLPVRNPMELKIQWSLLKLDAKTRTPEALAEMLERME